MKLLHTVYSHDRINYMLITESKKQKTAIGEDVRVDVEDFNTKGTSHPMQKLALLHTGMHNKHV